MLLGVIASGLVFVMGSQLGKAALDNADNTQEILEIIKNKYLFSL